MLIELIQIYEYYKDNDLRNYFLDSYFMINIGNACDYSQVILHTVFYGFKVNQLNKSTDLEKCNYYEGTVLILTWYLNIVILIKIQHILKIYKFFGLLNKLLANSFSQVAPFMLLFFMWNWLFAMELFILKSNREDAETFANGIETG